MYAVFIISLTKIFQTSMYIIFQKKMYIYLLKNENILNTYKKPVSHTPEEIILYCLQE